MNEKANEEIHLEIWLVGLLIPKSGLHWHAATCSCYMINSIAHPEKASKVISLILGVPKRHLVDRKNGHPWLYFTFDSWGNMLFPENEAWTKILNFKPMLHGLENVNRQWVKIVDRSVTRSPQLREGGRRQDGSGENRDVLPQFCRVTDLGEFCD